jgi:hypothetical protein
VTGSLSGRTLFDKFKGEAHWNVPKFYGRRFSLVKRKLFEPLAPASLDATFGDGG